MPNTWGTSWGGSWGESWSVRAAGGRILDVVARYQPTIDATARFADVINVTGTYQPTIDVTAKVAGDGE